MAHGIWRTNLHLDITKERPELSPHYNVTVRKFRTCITFCVACTDPTCAMNLFIVLMFLSTCELIAKFTAELDDEHAIRLTMHHFFRDDELIHFLDEFTKVSKIDRPNMLHLNCII